ncbi:DUF6907 domain-containing protein [Streptomyces sp. NBC_01190]|uniref:DUF6907 domain-containing protein n=1 Tax=Streptomyces sp. NBC_01190 TaxID=2903767 RepID=UPI00386F5A76|nr:hypothetical protein OG519_17275 [Streptomyces sp. NBC_01190]
MRTTTTGYGPVVASAAAAEGQLPACRTPSEAPGGTWTIETSGGYTATGYLPTWAEEDPSESGIPLGRLPATLADITHRAPFEGQCVAAVHGSGLAETAEILSGSIDCTPYAEDPDPRGPVANIRIIDDYWINGLDEDGLAAFAEQLRAQAALLEGEVGPALAAARAEMAAAGG